MADDHMQRVLEARGAFVTAYCRSKGWPEDPDELTMEQVMEIRAQPEWKNAAAGQPIAIVNVVAPKR